MNHYHPGAVDCGFAPDLVFHVGTFSKLSVPHLN